MHAMSFLKCALLYQNEPHPRFKILFFQPPPPLPSKFSTNEKRKVFFLTKKLSPDIYELLNLDTATLRKRSQSTEIRQRLANLRTIY